MIEVNNVSFEIDGKKILKDINLKIPEGKIYGIIGPNGVGKTTLLRCLTGIYETTNGEVLYDSENVYDNPKVKEVIGYVADENIMHPNFRVRDVIKFHKYSYPMFDEEKFKKLNEIFKISENRFIFQLSKGMKMRLSILSTLFLDPYIYKLKGMSYGLLTGINLVKALGIEFGIITLASFIAYKIVNKFLKNIQ